MDFENTRIVFPPELTMVCRGRKLPSQIPDSLPTLVIYVSPDECSVCAVAHLSKYEELFSLQEAIRTFNVIIVLSPSAEEYDSVEDYLIISKYDHPVYLDTYSEFSRINLIPEDDRFHCFLISEEGKPIMIGNPLANDKTRVLFNTILSNH